MVEGGNHYLNATNPTEVASTLLALINKHQ